MFEEAGLQDVAKTTIEVTLSYRDFEAFWDAQTPSYSPTTRIIAAMSAREREQLKNLVRVALPTGRDGAIEYAARANAVKARV